MNFFLKTVTNTRLIILARAGYRFFSSFASRASLFAFPLYFNISAPGVSLYACHPHASDFFFGLGGLEFSRAVSVRVSSLVSNM